MIVLGVGLLKPNISAIVAQLYPEGGARRDAGFSIFYMGINLGAFLGSLLVPIVAAALRLERRLRVPAHRHGARPGAVPGRPSTTSATPACVPLGQARRSWWPVHRLRRVVVGGARQRWRSPAPCSSIRSRSRKVANWALLALAAGYFAYLLFFAGLDRVERKRVVVMIALFVACAMFWAGFEQTGASFNLFAERYTDRNVFGWDMPAGVVQSVNPCSSSCSRRCSRCCG